MNKNASNNKIVLDNFFDKVEKQVVKVQRNIVKDALNRLFKTSPHADAVMKPDLKSGGNKLVYIDGKPPTNPGDGVFAQSEYDANHKINIDGKGFGPHNPPTFNRTISSGLNKIQQSKTRQIKVGSKVMIGNDTAHAMAVETGGVWQEHPGYHTYKGTKNYLKNKYRKVLSTI